MQQLKTKSSLSNKNTLLALGFAAFVFLFWALIFHFSPMTEDDHHFWSLRLTELGEVWSFALNYGNGRLLGNLGIFFLVEYKLLRVFIKALVMTGICLLLPKALNLKGKFFYIGSFLMLSLCAPRMFAQVYTWTSGFQNYVPCIFLLLVVLCLCRAKKYRAVLCPVVFVLSVAMELYVEHSSVVNVLSALALSVYAIKTDKKMLPMSLSFLLGALLGLMLMLRIPEMSPVPVVDMAVYKGTVFSLGLGSALVTMVKNALVLLARFSENVLLVSGLGVTACLLLHKNSLHLEKHEKNILFFTLLLPCALMDLAHLSSMGEHYGDAALFETIILAAAMGIWLLAFAYSLVRLALIMKSKSMYLALVLLLFALVAAAPLLLLRPMVIRMAWHCYVIFTALLLLLLKLSLDEKALDITGKALALMALVSCLWLTIHFADIDRMTNIREDYIAACVEDGQYKLDYFLVPSDYVFNYWDWEVYSWYYDSLYGVDIELDIIPADTWLTEYYH